MATQAPKQEEDGSHSNTTSEHISLEEELRRKLEWACHVWIGFQAFKMQIYDSSIVDIVQKSHEEMNIDPSDEEMENIDIYEVILGSSTDTMKRQVEWHLLRAAILNRSCVDSAYFLLPKVQEILKDDDRVLRVEWMRRALRPFILMVYEDEDTPEIFLHDYLRIDCTERRSFVLDVSGYQFGLSDFFYTAESFEAYICDTISDPEHIPTIFKMESEDEDDPELAEERGHVFDTIAEVEKAWLKDGISWKNIHTIPGSERKRRYGEMRSIFFEGSSTLPEQSSAWIIQNAEL